MIVWMNEKHPFIHSSSFSHSIALFVSFIFCQILHEL